MLSVHEEQLGTIKEQLSKFIELIGIRITEVERSVKLMRLVILAILDHTLQLSKDAVGALRPSNRSHDKEVAIVCGSVPWRQGAIGRERVSD